MKTNAEMKCERCGKEEILYLIEYTAWVCAKDHEKILKFLKRLKGNHRTRYQSVQSFVNSHKLEV